ncbi:MAG TPA: aconitate hydratase [bacterium]|nr:aconitate hydratase [bacterium]HQP97704.1 aconitate hydratase [bacterium]
MGKTLVQKIFESHRVGGSLVTGEQIQVKVDQVITQDATGTMTYLEFEAIGVPRVKVPVAVSYVDHNLLQQDFKNPDDHIYLQTAAAKYGAYFSKPGNGICHQVHLERFAAPGAFQIGTDSHTPTAGGMGAIAIGVGGLDAATVLAGGSFEITMPKVVNIRLTGELRRPWVTAMDVILEVLRRLTVKGNVGKIMEYGGPGVRTLSLTERATITNMGAELGATTSIFPSDENTLAYLKAQKRESVWKELQPDPDAEYDDVVEIDLGSLDVLVAQPHSPDAVVPIRELAGLKPAQVCIGSCTNSSYPVMQSVGRILEDRSVAPHVSLGINPGSKQVYEMLARNGDTASMIASGARLLESGCGPCIGMGYAPASDSISVRSYNRNFPGRSGTKSARVYLCNPLACAVIAIKGELCDPRDTDITFEPPSEPKTYIINDNLLLPPADDPDTVEVIRGPNIKTVPVKEPLKDVVEAPVLLKTGDNITTDDIMPAGAQALPFRSNIPELAKFVYSRYDETFSDRARQAGKCFIVGADNYGQGSSREHAAIAPMYLGLEAVIVKSLARIHRANLINFGILPLTFENPADYDTVDLNDVLCLRGLHSSIVSGGVVLSVENKTKRKAFPVRLDLTPREVELIRSGGLLPHTKREQE